MKLLWKLFCLFALVLAVSPAFSESAPGEAASLERTIDAAVSHISALPAHPAVVDIDVDAFADNIRRVKNMIGSGTGLCLVMKSNAYGHGLENLIGPAIESEPRYIALVENADIALAAARIRASGKTIPILRIAPATLDEAVEAAVRKWNVEELVGSVEQAEMLSAVALRLGKTGRGPVTIPVHVNIDTGMGRMGISSADEARRIMAMPGLVLKGIMTHFAQSDDMTPRGEKRTREQLQKFEGIVKSLQLNRSVVCHVANSAAVARFYWSMMDMVRVGSLIYGDVNDDTDPEGVFRPVMRSFRSSVALIMRDVPSGTTVGYDSIYKTRRRSTLATVKVGYNNGYPKDACANGVEVLIGGKRCPVVGKVSMNMLVVDVTGREVNVGDEVVLLGRQGDDAITMEELATRCRTTTYELLLRLGNSNTKRVVRRWEPGK